MKIQHFLISRFNLGLYTWTEFETKDPETWPILTRKTILESPNKYLDYRLKLFDTFTYPSICGQTNQNFKWLMLLSEDTPIKYREIFEQYTRFIPIYCKGQWRSMKSHVQKLIHNYIDNSSDFIITTRLDVDDMLHRNYMDNVQNDIPKKHNTSLYYKFGHVINFKHRDMYLPQPAQTVYDQSYPHNQFPSIIEEPNKVRTIWCESHGILRKSTEDIIIKKEPMWCWIVHGKNMSTFRGNITKSTIRLGELQPNFTYKQVTE